MDALDVHAEYLEQRDQEIADKLGADIFVEPNERKGDYAVPINIVPEFQERVDPLSAITTGGLVSQYRELKANADTLAREMNTYREAILKRVEVQDYQDDIGYAKMRARKASTSYPAGEITRVRDVWLNSDVPEIRTCGEMLRSFGKLKPSTTYLEIR